MPIRIDRFNPVILHAFHIVHISINLRPVIIDILFRLYGYGIKHISKITDMLLPNLKRGIPGNIILDPQCVHQSFAGQYSTFVIPMGISP